MLELGVMAARSHSTDSEPPAAVSKALHPAYTSERAGHTLSEMAKARRVRAAIEKAGWTLVRIRGSHRIYRKGGRTVPFAYHDHADLGGPALAVVAREFGMTMDELRRLL
jgi:predicted RNA binding protein YcfA (HicA-like mRNA interferase family)